MALWILHGACPERTRGESEGGVEGLSINSVEMEIEGPGDIEVHSPGDLLIKRGDCRAEFILSESEGLAMTD